MVQPDRSVLPSWMVALLASLAMLAGGCQQLPEDIFKRVDDDDTPADGGKTDVAAEPNKGMAEGGEADGGVSAAGTEGGGVSVQKVEQGQNTFAVLLLAISVAVIYFIVRYLADRFSDPLDEP